MTTPTTRIALDLRWRDLDAFGHLNNASTVSLFEEARIRWLNALLPDWHALSSAPVLAAITVNYRQPAHYPETLVVEQSVLHIGTSSVRMALQALLADGGVHADGEVVLVWVDRSSGTPCPLPAVLRERFEASTREASTRGE